MTQHLLPAALLLLAAVPASARPDCRPPRDLPPGVTPPQRVGCPAAAPAANGGLRPGRTPGFVDLGNGTEVRISGRVRVETGASR
ncbi:hypothetical protein [Salinarimonas soli]|uniref:Uncharacterized protein n=1 Tax=Salinarimonas soli TaxID=1638099 RepID=A0A5B2V9Y7_9HYPH|nr:hypothetical protein [Salinarimonas soli]KAA2235149.1 hypothetical protein F0L46_20605 [Salinarimonas soli]